MKVTTKNKKVTMKQLKRKYTSEMVNKALIGQALDNMNTAHERNVVIVADGKVGLL